ncbi:MAG: prepilin-type processing-associated H-X9-DG protein [Verrucomicrobiales bacterium]|jgi:prepilin-type processing-associated H-X9-DG protein
MAVIMIVAVFASILFASHRYILRRARGVDCQGHLRQIHLALDGYLSDHNLQIPVMRATRADKSDGVEPPTMDVLLAPYIDNVASFKCPADNEDHQKSGCSYYWNSLLNGQTSWRLNFLTITDEPKIPLFADKGPWHTGFGDHVNVLYADGHVEKDFQFW